MWVEGDITASEKSEEPEVRKDFTTNLMLSALVF